MGKAMVEMVDKIKKEVGTTKWQEMRMGVREEMREDIARRVALFIQQTESELGRVKTAVREKNEVTPLQNGMQNMPMEMDGVVRASRTALQAAEAASGTAKGMEAKVQGPPWTLDHAHPMHPAQLQTSIQQQQQNLLNMHGKIQTMSATMMNMQRERTQEMRELQTQNQFLLQNINELRQHLLNLNGGFTAMQQSNIHKEQQWQQLQRDMEQKITSLQQGMPLSTNPSHNAMVLGALQPNQAIDLSHAAGLTAWPTPKSGEPGQVGQGAATGIGAAGSQAARVPGQGQEEPPLTNPSQRPLPRTASRMGRGGDMFASSMETPPYTPQGMSVRIP